MLSKAAWLSGKIQFQTGSIMGLFRLLAFALIVWVVWRMIKNYQAKVAKNAAASEKVKIPVREKMVKCEYCSIHLPQDEAIAGGEHWFCKPEHKQLFIKRDT